ncbi:MAG: DUF1080 domain-containing protein [Candidatus Saccharicenans sp.]|nr:DUF1080 domain-containing protein [Candidatus Saccharicenans sp.]
MQKVDSWLRHLPAQNQEEAEKIFTEMLLAGSPVVYELGRRLAAPGEGDDSLARYALDGLVILSGRPGRETQKERLADDLLRLTSAARADEIRKFLLEEAQYLVDQKHLTRLASFLNNPSLTDCALRAMLRVKGPELEKILVDCLNRVPAEASIPIIQALGNLRTPKAAIKLRLLASSSDPAIKNAALAALAEIPDPTAEPLLASLPTLSSHQERRLALELYLRFARRLAEEGHKEKALAIARRMTEILTAEEAPLRCEALSLVAEIVGEKSVPDLIKAVWSEESSYRQQALKLAREYRWPGLLSELVEQLAGLPAINRAAVIEFLGGLDSGVKAEIIEPYLDDGEKEVRLAAIRTMFRLEKEKAASRLLVRLNTSEDEARLIIELLRTLKPEYYLDQIKANYAHFSDGTKLAVLQNLSDIIGPGWKKEVLSSSESEIPELKKAAIECLSQTVDSSDLAWLIDRYVSLQDASLSPGYQKAIVSALGQIQDSALRQKTFLNQIDKRTGKERAELIKLLPQVGGSACLASTVQFLNDRSPEIRAAAVAALSNWPDFEASSHLVNLVKQSDNRTFRYLAFQGLARLIKDTPVDREMKFRVLDELKNLAVYPDEKNFLLTAWGSLKEVRALKELAGFFMEENLRERAATLACRLARPASGEMGLSGFETIMILKRALPLLRDELEIEETEIYLDKLLRLEGFVPLFNRKDLNGWKGLVADPVQRAKMNLEELRAAQKNADQDMRLHWKVVAGELVFDGQGHSLCTVKDYCDFELFVDWKIEPGGDSGIYLRGSPQVQIWDPAQWPEGSGGLYNNQKNPNKPLQRADNPVGTWNTFYIKMVDERVTVYLNGVLVVDNVIMENYWERDKPIYRCGQIELQAHNTPLYFKNIYIREIK